MPRSAPDCKPVEFRERRCAVRCKDRAIGGSRQMGKIRRAIGLMSGTSMDGIDVAAIETDGDTVVRRLEGFSVSYDDAFRQRLAHGIREADRLEERDRRPGQLAQLERDLTSQHVEAVEACLSRQKWQGRNVDVIGFHGQTLLHRPERRLTLQIGDGRALHAATGIPVVYDLRAADVAAGGQGAPLAPVYHRAMVAKLPERPVAVINVGGVANVTWIGGRGDLIAFDTGPGNALIDDWMREREGVSHDRDGALAATGRVDQDRLAQVLDNRYFALRPPKSLDRNAFDVSCLSGLGTADGAATLTALTAHTIAKACAHMPVEPVLWVVCGGGRRNRTLMSMLAGAVRNAVVPAEVLGFDGDTVEAEAWAYLAVRALDGAALTFPGTTGVGAALSGGVIVGQPPD